MIPARSVRTWIPLVCGGILYFFVNVERVAVPGAVFDELQTDFRLSAPRVTALGSAFMYVYALVQLPVGFLVARYGGARVIAAGGFVFFAGAALFPACASFPALCFARALTGLGAGTIYLALISETIRAFPGHHAAMVSAVVMTGYAGGMVANGPLTAGVALWGWRMVLSSAALSIALAWGGFMLASAGRPFPPVRRDSGIGHFGPVLRDGGNRAVFLFGGMNFGLYYVLQTVIGKKFLEDFRGASAVGAGWTLSLMGAISASAGVLFAVLSRLAGNRRRLFCRVAGLVCCAGFALAALSVGAGGGRGMTALFCLLAFTASTSSILIPLLHETNPPERAEQAVGMMNFAFYLFVAVFGNLAGVILDHGPARIDGGVTVYGREGYLALFGAGAVAALAVLYFAFRIREPRRGNGAALNEPLAGTMIPAVKEKDSA